MDVMSDLNIAVSHMVGRVPVTVFRLEGRVNLSNSEKLEKMAREAHEYGMRYMLMDLSGVPSITSAGLRAILYTYRLLENNPASKSSPASLEPAPELISKSAHFKLFTPSPQVLKVLQTAGFETFIDIFENMEEAIASF